MASSILVMFLLLGSARAFANENLPDKVFGVDMTAGFPQLLGLEVSYLAWSSFVPSLSFGSLPVNNLLNSYLKLKPVPVNFSLPDTYYLDPKASFSLSSFTFQLKYFLPKSGFFGDFILSSINFGANVNADLRNQTSGATFSNLATGSASLTQWILGAAFGYQVVIGSRFYIEAALGLGYLPSPSYSLSISGTAANAVGLIPNGQQAFDDAKAQVKSSFDSAVATYHSSIKFLPFTFLNMGFAF